MNAVFSAIKKEVGAGGEVKIFKFGTFSVAELGEREGRDPRTGVSVVIPARATVHVPPGHHLQEGTQWQWRRKGMRLYFICQSRPVPRTGFLGWRSQADMLAEDWEVANV